MASIQRLQSASDRHVGQRESILIELLKLILGLWSGFDRWDDENALNGMVARTATLVSSATTRTRRAQRSYLSSVLADYGVDTRGLPTLVDSYPRANTDALEVYRRPVEQFIWKRRNGGTLAESEEAFQERLRKIAEADVLAAEREESLLVYNATPEIIGHRRIIHPEKSRSGTCGLCIVAATQFYKKDELLPLHNGCWCDTAPITATSDPGLHLNADDLKAIYAAAGSTAAEDLKNTRVAIKENGELGPVLVREGQNFKTPADAGRPAFVRQTPAMKAESTKRELAKVRVAIDDAQRAYDDYVAQNPSTLVPNSSNQGERIGLFRAIKFLREYAQVLENRASALSR
jgi:hypothetical protein